LNNAIARELSKGGPTCALASRGGLAFASALLTSSDGLAQESTFLALKAAGQNRLMPHCFEFVDGVQLQPTQVQRSFVGRVTWGA